MNIAHNIDCLEFMATCKDKEFDVIFIDPPYFKIKGEFDFKMNFEEWIQLHKDLANLCHRILKDNGTIILWGHAKNIAYQQIEFDKYFNLLNSCVWEKTSCQTKKISIDAMRAFIPTTERFLFYDKGELGTGLEKIYSNPDLFLSIKKYVREEKEKIKRKYDFSCTQFNDYINETTSTSSVASRHYFSDSQWVFPTKEMYLRLQKTGFFKREYESLRREYESLRRPFNLDQKIANDVIR